VTGLDHCVIQGIKIGLREQFIILGLRQQREDKNSKRVDQRKPMIKLNKPHVSTDVMQNIINIIIMYVNI